MAREVAIIEPMSWPRRRKEGMERVEVRSVRMSWARENLV
jgi:hypothetical protein